jgi:hypothetical protein
MSKESATTKLTRARNVLRGLKKLLKPRGKMLVDGVPRSRGDMEALFQSHIDAIDAKARRYAAYQQAVAAERAIARKTNALWINLYLAVRGQHGLAGVSVLGMKPHKKPGPKTLASKLAGVQKRARRKRPT